MKKLKNQFNFIPEWRLDDVMVSFAVPGGSVGAHVDYYDVFLIQLKGCRRWQIEDKPRPNPKHIDGLELKILESFNPAPDLDWKLEPGDMLYLPPGVPHLGVAETACLTASVGFRAPSFSQIQTALGLETSFNEWDRYSDPGLQTQAHGAEILPSDIDRLYDQLKLSSSNEPFSKEELATAFGRLVTQTSQSLALHNPDQTQPYHDSAFFTLNEESRLAFYAGTKKVTVFVSGQDFSFSPSSLPAIEWLTQRKEFRASDIEVFRSDPAFMNFFKNLVSWEVFQT